MISIVERLRSYVRANESEAMGMSPCGLCESAADEIERLIEARQVRDKHIDALKADRDALAKRVEAAFRDGFSFGLGGGRLPSVEQAWRDYQRELEAER